MSVTQNLSGIVFELLQGDNADGNQAAFAWTNPFLNTYLPVNQTTPDWVYQEFRLPDNYQRGEGDKTPPLTAIQIFCAIESGYAKTAALDYKLEHYEVSGWETLTEGTVLGAHSDGDEVWFDLYFDHPVDIKDAWLTDSFRFGVKARNNTGVKDVPCPYNPLLGILAALGQAINIRIEPGELKPLTVNSIPALVYRDPDSDECLLSYQYGVKWLWYAVAPPFSWALSYLSGGTPIQHNNIDVAFKFKILAGVADSGQDIIGNPQRQTIHWNSADNLDTFTNKTENDFWLSKPNPSEFAVESLYFDMTSGSGLAQVVDRVLIDPITVGVYFHVYFSNDGDPGTSEIEWERKLWTPVVKTFQMNRREVHALPNPITAKYIKVEFSHLRPEKYEPGDFQVPIRFKKHPKWVLNYFLARLSELQTSDDPIVASRVRVNYNALDLAYNYYLDDLGQEPDAPVHLDQSANENLLSQFLTDQSDAAEQVDPITLGKITTAFQPFQKVPGTAGAIESVLKLYNNAGTNYPIETIADPRNPSFDVSSLRRERLIFENQFPVMFFYVTARHLYRVSEAQLNYNRAYFAGVREVAFTRDNYTAQADDQLYVEGVGDNVNVERNDFKSDPVTFDWVAHT